MRYWLLLLVVGLGCAEVAPQPPMTIKTIKEKIATAGTTPMDTPSFILIAEDGSTYRLYQYDMREVVAGDKLEARWVPPPRAEQDQPQ